jgi:hypothetical protein
MMHSCSINAIPVAVLTPKYLICTQIIIFTLKFIYLLVYSLNEALDQN